MLSDRWRAALAEPDRLRAYAAVVLGAAGAEAVADAAGLSLREASAALRRLVDSGLVEEGATGLVARAGVFKDAVRERAPAPEPAGSFDVDQQRDAVLRTYLGTGRLTRIPAARGKRRIVLQHLAAAFEPGVRYPEREVNATLRAWHDDHAALRRYLVEEALLSRDHGVYWRTG